jgi:PBSX family phage terminase large subunit
VIDTKQPLSEKQVCSIKDATGTVNIWQGSVRSGKTISSLLRWLIYVASYDLLGLTGELVVVARTRESAMRNVFAPLMEPGLYGDIAQYVHYTSGAPTAKILGRTVHVLGTVDSKSEKVLRGLTCAGAYVDEVTLVPEDFFVQLLNRLWGKAQLFGTTNPDNPAHWLKRKYLDRLNELPDWRSFKFTLDDNPALTEENKDRIKRQNVGLFYRRFVLGEWVAAEGAIFDMWEPARYVVSWEKVPKIERLISTGIDYGTTNATSALLLALAADRNRITGKVTRKLVLLDEWRYDAGTKDRRLTDSELSTRLRAWMNDDHVPDNQILPSNRPDFTLIDPAAASFKVQLHKDGVKGLADGNNDVLYGIRLMASLLAADRLLVTDRCQGFIQEAPGYSWDDKETEKGNDKPLKVADHSLDAGRYAITTTEALWRKYVDLAA